MKPALMWLNRGSRTVGTILSSHRVTKRFGGLVAVSGFDVDIQERSIHSIIGPNGAGKTTFFNCITGFYRHEEGTILFQDEPLDGMPPDRITREGIARTYQNIRLFQNMTVIENVMVDTNLFSRQDGLARCCARVASGQKRREPSKRRSACSALSA